MLWLFQLWRPWHGLSSRESFSLNCIPQRSMTSWSFSPQDEMAKERSVSESRRRNMAAIRGKNTTPEMLVRRFLHASGLRYKLHDPTLPGRPDIVLKRLRTIVEVQGCFWHHHNCANSVWPQTRAK